MKHVIIAVNKDAGHRIGVPRDQVAGTRFGPSDRVARCSLLDTHSCVALIGYRGCSGDVGTDVVALHQIVGGCEVDPTKEIP